MEPVKLRWFGHTWGERTGARHTRSRTQTAARRRSLKGVALVWTALLLVIIVGVVGLGVDFGKAAWNVHQLHNAADAAALAARRW